MACEDRVEEVVIKYADRFNRFGHAYLECVCDSFSITFTRLEPKEDKTPDLLSVFASLSGRMSGMVFHKQKELVT